MTRKLTSAPGTQGYVDAAQEMPVAVTRPYGCSVKYWQQ